MVERHSMAGLRYGHGLQPSYDLIAIERQVAVSLVANKCELTMVTSHQLTSFHLGTMHECPCMCLTKNQNGEGGGIEQSAASS